MEKLKWYEKAWKWFKPKAETFLDMAWQLAIMVVVNIIGPTIRDIVVAVEKSHVGEDKWSIVKSTAKIRFPSTETVAIEIAMALAVAFMKERGLEVKK